MKNAALTFIISGLLLSAGMSPAPAQQLVKVGGYEFPPYVEVGGDNRPQGLTLDLIDLLNRRQSAHRFEFHLTTPARRYRDFEAGQYDMIAFESRDWGWTQQNIAIDASKVFFHDSEVYITRQQDGRGQSWFDSLADRSVAGILGYHYAFTNYEGNPETLKQKYRMVLVNSHPASIEVVLRGRADVGVVTKSYLTRYLRTNPAATGQLLVSSRTDQIYAHTILIRPGLTPNVAEVNNLLDRLSQDGSLTAMFRAADVIE